MIKILRLSAVGSIGYTLRDDPQPIIWKYRASTDQQKQITNWHNYLLSANEEKRFIRLIAALLKKKEVYNKEKQINHVNIAFDRYSEALIEYLSTERGIASVILRLCFQNLV